MKSKYWTFLYFCWIAAILWLSLVPGPPQVDLPLLSWDKFQHATAYGVLAVLGGYGFQVKLSQRSAWFCSIFIAILLGGLVEILQGMTSSRSADWLDFLANTFGAVVFSIPFLRSAMNDTQEK